MLTSSAIDRLGERLRDGSDAEEDLTILEAVRREFAETEARVFPVIRQVTGFEVNPRKGKTTQSIRAKLIRERTRLSSMQDIVGGRIVVPDMIAQDIAAAALLENFVVARSYDLRPNPRHGYRAVHVIIQDPRPVEIQIRTMPQDQWAQLSEKLCDRFGFQLKYGGGPAPIRQFLLDYAEVTKEFDELKLLVHDDGVTSEAFKQRADRVGRRIDETFMLLNQAVKAVTEQEANGATAGE